MASSRRDMGIYDTMPTDALDARVLLEVAPDQYVTERTRVVKQARADKDKVRAGFYQSTEASNGRAVGGPRRRRLGRGAARSSTATSELGNVQAGGSNAAALSAATQRRRTTLEGFVDRAVNALAMFDAGAEKRRPEIRSLVDQLSRHPELAEAGSMARCARSPTSSSDSARSRESRWHPRPRAEAATRRCTGEGQAQAVQTIRAGATAARCAISLPSGRTRAKLKEQAREAKKDLAEAARELTAADRKLAVARAAVKKAEKELRLAEDQRAVAERRHERAVAHHESLH